MCHCLRKQESRLLWACSCGLDGQSGTLEYFLDSRLCGHDTLGLGRRGRSELLHSAKMILFSEKRTPTKIYAPPHWTSVKDKVICTILAE